MMYLAPNTSPPSVQSAAVESMEAVMSGRRGTFDRDAALEHQAAPTYTTRRDSFAEVIRAWEAQIASEQLRDVEIASLHDLSVDPRDGALVRGGGGLCYTPHAWRQLVQLFRIGAATPVPSEVIAADMWHAPLTRHFAFADVKRASLRSRDKGATLRTFTATVNGRSYRTLRAVVSERHSLQHTDDLAVARVLEALDEQPVEGRVTRAWNKTYGSFVLAANDPDVQLGFAFANSETGCSSLQFSGSITLRALDVEIVRPDAVAYAADVAIASEGATTRRNHTLPSKGLTEDQRAGVAARRIASDIQKALAGSRALLASWERAKTMIEPQLVPLAKMTEVDDLAVEVLSDALQELGAVPEAAQRSKDALRTFARSLATVMADDARLRKLPHGSRAHLAATLAVLASKAKTWDTAREAQQLAGEILARC